MKKIWHLIIALIAVPFIIIGCVVGFITGCISSGIGLYNEWVINLKI